VPAKPDREPRVTQTMLAVFSLVLLFGLGHMIGVLLGAIRRSDFVYDFRFYSMLLVGGLMIVPSIVGLRQLPGLRRRKAAAWRRARHVSAVLLAVNLPMLPMQHGRTFVLFGSLVAGLAAIALVHLSTSRNEFTKGT
jgi:hypothetical protein